MLNFLLYFFPFAMDIVVSLLLFVGRHSLAANGASEFVVGSVPMFFGIGYFLSGPIMRAIISRKWAKVEMIISIAILALLSVVLARIESVVAIQILFCLIPFSVSLFFNAFQIYMLGISNDHARPLAVTLSIYTFAWSLGYGVGPFVIGLARDFLTWSQSYYVSALSCLVIALMVLAFRPPRPNPESKVDSPPEAESARPLLFVPGWIGVVIGLIGWTVIATYWPIIAVSAGISPELKGIVEFCFAAAQALAALALILLKDWQHRPYLLPFFGLVGVSALLTFGSGNAPLWFILGAAMMGCYTASTFLFSAFHCMLDAKMASKRVAVNEMMVGLGYVLGPILASALHGNGTPFFHSFALAAGLIAILVTIQTGIALSIRRRSRI
ncbi:MAG: MFS transporter [Acidobacteriota bacterium]|nr:MAG: MFS transporter [Acidobacteriota bacterium]